MCPAPIRQKMFFEFPHFVIYSAKRFPTQNDGNTLHIKPLLKASFPEWFLCKMSMLPKAARPFGSIVWAIIQNWETQKDVFLANFPALYYNKFYIITPAVHTASNGF